MAKDEQFIAQNITDICASIQASIVEILLKKLRKAAKETGIKEIAIAGGVSANSWLRAKLQEEAVKHRWTVHVPAFEYCTDNAAMIAMAAHYKYEQQEFVNLQAGPLPRLAL
jgi:N6-L-threonylcarbamoyladenine synthase